ncbi:hypothetical protein FHQ18_09920 [Deferribacter autotrophicus]|uniref:Pilus assembly protein PilM n=1 Tax=Deferribacter autotrophicus TaxID=500465 RepID=A0A5A8F6L0_9BACT|nr:hypothetical protein [Deferribacter autotrophicus]KAA0257354.1 hypothetical protein FHQ18_09920 [Deferribacter autotrophicus]
MQPKNLSVLCFDDKNVEFINGTIKSSVLEPFYFAKCSYSTFDELISSSQQFIKESNSKFLKIIYAGAELIDAVYFFSKNLPNIATEIFQKLKNDFEIELKDYLIDYAIYEGDYDLAVYVCCFPKHIQNLFEKVKQTKLISAFSDVYAQNLFYQNEEQTTLFVNVRSYNSTLIIKQSETIFLTRGVNVGYEQIIENVATKGGVNSADVIKYLQEIGVENYELEEKKIISDTIKNSIDRISLEIQRTIDYYNRFIKKGSINRIYITGKLNNIKALTKYYSKLFNIKTDLIITEQNIKETDYDLDNFDYLTEILGAFYEL